jgi:2-haloacid dehalogenase
MPLYRWVMFDADNTLFDFNAAEDSALRATFDALGFPFEETYYDLYRAINAQVWLEYERKQITSSALRVARFERLFQAIQVQGDAQAFSKNYLVNLARGSQLMEGAEALIKTLHGHAGVMLALVTNGLKDVQRPRLASSPIADCFQAVVISEEIGKSKPDSGFFEIAFERMGRPSRKDVLLVGDSLSADIQGGIGFGVATCWYNPRRLPADPRCQPSYEVSHLHQVLALVDGANPIPRV